MSLERMVEAFALDGASPAAKLLAIYVGNNSDEYDTETFIDMAAAAHFVGVASTSIPGLLRDLVWKGIYSQIDDFGEGFIVSFTTHTPMRRSPGDKLSKAVREAVLSRDHNCIYCGDTDGPFQIDHIIPRSRGGKDVLENLARACAPCNLAKRDRLIGEWAEVTDRKISLSRALEIIGGAT